MLETTFFYTFAIGGAILAVQMLMTFLGGDDGDIGDGGIDGDFEMGDVEDAGQSTGAWLFEVISLRTLAAAATFFGLTGMTAQSYGVAPSVAFLLAGLAGFGAMYLVYWAFKQLYRLESTGAQDIRKAVGLPGEVYLRVPPNGTGIGKVHIELQGRTVEYAALTNDLEALATGSRVLVTEIVNGDTLRVERESVEA